MSRKPRAVQPWSSPAAAKRHLASALGHLESEGYLSSVRATVGFFEAALNANRLRKYRRAIGDATHALARLEEERLRFGFEQDAGELGAAASALAVIVARHNARTDPPPVLSVEGTVRYRLPSQLPDFFGNGEWIESPEKIDTLRGLAAALGAAQWFERCESEGAEARRPLGPTILFITAVALGLEQPTDEAHSFKGGAVDKVQRRWAKRLKLARADGKSQLSLVVGDDWQHRSAAEQRAVRAEVARLHATGRPVEARARRLSLGMNGDRGNRGER